MAREFYIVSVDRPEGVTVAEMKNYIQTAVSRWSSGYNPKHPLFDAFDGFGKTVYAQRMGLGSSYKVDNVQWSDRCRQAPKLTVKEPRTRGN